MHFLKFSFFVSVVYLVYWYISSEECQKTDWNSGHQRKCNDVGITTLTPYGNNGRKFRDSPFRNRYASKIALVPDRGYNKSSLKTREVLGLLLLFFIFFTLF